MEDSPHARSASAITSYEFNKSNNNNDSNLGDARLYNELGKLITTDRSVLNALFNGVAIGDVDSLALNMMKIALALGTSKIMFSHLLRKEFERAQGSTKSILRANTLTTKIMDQYIQALGLDFLRQVLSEPINLALEDDTLDCELDPNKIQLDDPEKKEIVIQEHAIALKQLAQLFIDAITAESTAASMPAELRAIANIIGELAIEYSFDKSALIGGFVLLRLFNPSILLPELKGLTAKKISPTQRRNLVLVSKIIQNISNGLDFGYKEEYMIVANPLIEANQQKMNKFLDSFCPEDDDEQIEHRKQKEEEECRAQLEKAMRDCVVSMTMRDEIVIIHELIMNNEQRIFSAYENSFQSDPSFHSTTPAQFKELLSHLPTLTRRIRARAGQHHRHFTINDNYMSAGLASVALASANSSSNDNTIGTEAANATPLTSSSTTTSSSSSSASASGASSEEATDSKYAEENERYKQLLEKALSTDLSDIESKNIITQTGKDKEGRPVMLFIESRLPTQSREDLERVLLYVIKKFDKVTEGEYVVVYCVNQAPNVKRPEFSWLAQLYRTFTRKYKKNMKRLFIIHPTFWLKVIFRLFKPFVSGKFWKKVVYFDNVAKLFDYIDQSQISLPPDVLQYDIMVNKKTKSAAEGGSSSSQKSATTSIFGVALEELMSRPSQSGQDVPYIVSKTVAWLEENALDVEGIFRIPGSVNHINKYKELFDNGDNVDLTGADPHSVGGLLKMYIRELPTAIIPQDSYGKLLDISKNKIAKDTLLDDETIHEIQAVFQTLPVHNYNLLSKLLELLYKISLRASTNLMNPSNLAVVFGPNILRTPDDQNPAVMVQAIPFINKITAAMVQDYPKLFPNNNKQHQQQ